MGDYDVSANRGPRIDPEKARAFVKGFNEGDPNAGYHTAVIGGSIATGATIGAGLGSVIPGAGTAGGAIIGGAIGMTVGVCYLAYEKLTEKGYKGGR